MKHAFDEIYQKHLKSTGKLFVEYDWADREHYAYWLSQTYYFVKNSMQLLSMAAAHFSVSESEFQNRFIQHAAEEKGHDRLLINDLKNLDYKIGDIPELPETAGFYQSQYYWIQHISPFSFFGYVTILEGLAANYATDVFNRVEKKWGARAGSFLKVHGAEDTDHIQKALEKINKLDPDKLQKVVENFTLCSNMYSNILLAMDRQARQKTEAA